MACSFCKREIVIAARGLCRACYSRWQKSGTCEYQRKRTVCSVHGCGRDVVGGSLCDMHYRRMKRHGHMEQTRPETWGGHKKHPMYNSWSLLRRFRGLENMCESWRDDFLQFAMDVGERPSPKHKLFAADEVKPIGPDNFVWKRSLGERGEGECGKTHAARMARMRRKLDPERTKGYGTKKSYGLSFEQFQAMHDAQGGVCAICGKAETHTIRGKTLALAVDHCHTSGNIRGLLCAMCNTGLGCFKDAPAALRRAIEYLEAAPREFRALEGS